MNSARMLDAWAQLKCNVCSNSPQGSGVCTEHSAPRRRANHTGFAIAVQRPAPRTRRGGPMSRRLSVARTPNRSASSRAMASTGREAVPPNVVRLQPRTVEPKPMPRTESAPGTVALGWAPHGAVDAGDPVATARTGADAIRESIRPAISCRPACPETRARPRRRAGSPTRGRGRPRRGEPAPGRAKSAKA